MSPGDRDGHLGGSGWLGVTTIPVLTRAVPSQDKGTAELRTRDLAVELVLGVGVDGSGRPMVWSAGCDAHGTNLHVEFHQGHR